MKRFMKFGSALCALLLVCSFFLVSCDIDSILDEALGAQESKLVEDMGKPEETKKNNDKNKDKDNGKETDSDHEHNFSSGWQYNDQKHWLECSDKTCNKKFEKDDHQWTNNGSEKICLVCGATTTKDVESGEVGEVGEISKEAWASSFANYTVTMEGTMDVSLAGSVISTSYVKQEMKIANGKMLVTMLATDGSASDSDSLLYEGDIADTQIAQTSEIFLTLVNESEFFEYNNDTNTYTLSKDISYDTVLQSVINSPDGSLSTADVPTTIEMRDAEITVSSDGKLLKLVCYYAQIMDMGYGMATTTAGTVTWTFSNYGTTVID